MILDWFLKPVTEHYADFDGRASREQYWMYVLVNILVSIFVSFGAYVAESNLLYPIFSLAIFIPSLAIFVRRLHDIGKSGWWLLIGLVPFLGLLVLFIMSVLPGEPGPNKYGNPSNGTNSNYTSSPPNTQTQPIIQTPPPTFQGTQTPPPSVQPTEESANHPQ